MTFKFFFLPGAIPDSHVHLCIALAQGLRSLGHEVIANEVMWDDDLFLSAHGRDWDCEVLDYRYAYHVPPWSFEFRHKNSTPKILIDQMPSMNLTSPWLFHNWINKVDLILTTHGVIPSKKQFADKVFRWGLGLTNEVISLIDDTRGEAFSEEKKPWKSWRNEHSARRMVSTKLSDEGLTNCIHTKIVVDEKPTDVCIEGVSRFNKRYFEFMNQQRFTLAFCGHLESRPVKLGWRAPFNGNSAFRLVDRIEKKIFRKLRSGEYDAKNYAILQWDSYRFWECLYSDTIPISFDFEYWGIDTEVRPQAFEHYIPFRNSARAMFESIEQLSQEDLQRISRKGRAFFLDHHSPVAKAKRLLSCLNAL